MQVQQSSKIGALSLRGELWTGARVRWLVALLLLAVFLGYLSLHRLGVAPPYALLDQPLAIALDRHGNMYVSEWDSTGVQFRSGKEAPPRTVLARIVELSPTGRILRKWGRAGDLAQPGSVAVDGQGNVYVADIRLDPRQRRHDRLVRFSPSGTERTLLRSSAFPGIVGVAVDRRDRIWVSIVAGSYQARRTLVELSPRGRIIGRRDLGRDSAGLGTDRAAPAIGPQGETYVTDVAGVQRLASATGPWQRWSGLGSVGVPQFLAVGPDGALYVTGIPGGTQIDTLSSESIGLARVDPGGSVRWRHRAAQIVGQADLGGVTVDPRGRVYVVDRTNGRILLLAPNGKLLKTWS